MKINLRHFSAQMAIIFLLFVNGSATARAVTLIVNLKSVDQNEITASELRNIYTLENTAWLNKQTITVFTLPANEESHKALCGEVLSIYPHQLQRVWERALFVKPEISFIPVKNTEEMLKAVSSTPGAIGYVSEDNLGEFTDRIKRLTIIPRANKL